MAVDVATTGSGAWNSSAIPDVRDIVVNRNKAEKAYASSSTSQKIKRKAGHQDATGTFTVYTNTSNAGPTTILPFDEGDSGTLTLKSITGQTLYNASAQILTIEHHANIEAGDIVESTVTWGQD